MPPKCPSSQHDKRIQTLLSRAIHHAQGVPPPLKERGNWRLRSQDSHPHPLKKNEPQLPSKNTPNHQVIYGFRLLITEDTEARVRKISSSKSVRRPTSIMGDQPEKKGAFRRCPTLPNLFPVDRNNRALEQGIISRFGRV